MNNKSTKIHNLLEMCRIARSCFKESQLLKQEEIQSWLMLIDYSENLLTKGTNKLNSYQLNAIENELLDYWNNYLNFETEKFWHLVEEGGIQINRKPTFEKIMTQMRFKNVEQAIDVYNDLFSRSIKSYDSEDLKYKLDKLYEIVKLDRDKRISQFRKWIKNKKVSTSDRMKFGENYAYMKRTNQFDNIFGNEEKQIIEDLMRRQNST